MHAFWKVIRVLALVSAVGLSTTACGKYRISNLRSLMAFKEANQLYQRNDFTKAVEAYKRSIEYNPDFGISYFFLGNSYDNLYKPSRQGEPENDAYLQMAVDNYRKATETIKDDDPQGPEIRKLAYEYLIAAYGIDKIDDFAQAEPVALKLIELEPNEPGNYFTLAKLYEDQGMYDEAQGMFEKAIAVRPNDPLGYIMIAGYYNRQGVWDKTMEAWEQRAKIEPNNPEAHHTIATYLYDKTLKDFTLSRTEKRDNIERALAAEDAALALHADYVDALVYKGIILRLKASTETDPKRQKALIDEAEQLRNHALEVQKAQAGGSSGGDNK